MKTNALHRPAEAAPQRAAARDSRGLSETRLSHHDAANQDEAHPAQRRHDVEAFGGTAEPTLVDVLNEPIVATIMHCDGVALTALQGFMGHARAAVRARESGG